MRDSRPHPGRDSERIARVERRIAELDVGDPIGVRYTVIQNDGKRIRPDWVRVSKPIP